MTESQLHFTIVKGFISSIQNTPEAWNSSCYDSRAQTLLFILGCLIGKVGHNPMADCGEENMKWE